MTGKEQQLLARVLDLFHLPPRIIHVVDTGVALANKMAAWNERRLMRDLYDIWFLLQMKATPDTATLDQRLRKPAYSPMVKRKDYFPGRTHREFYDFIRRASRNSRMNKSPTSFPITCPRRKRRGSRCISGRPWPNSYERQHAVQMRDESSRVHTPGRLHVLHFAHPPFHPFPFSGIFCQRHLEPLDGGGYRFAYGTTRPALQL